MEPAIQIKAHLVACNTGELVSNGVEKTAIILKLAGFGSAHGESVTPI